MTKKQLEENKYLQKTIYLMTAAVSGHAMGVLGAQDIAHKQGRKYQYTYEVGQLPRKLIAEDAQKLFRYAYNLGKKQYKIHDKKQN